MAIHTSTGILGAFDPGNLRTPIIVQRFLKIGEKYTPETFERALEIIGEVLQSDEPAGVDTWEHSSVRNWDDQGWSEFIPPENVPEQLFPCLVDLLFDPLIFDGLRATQHYYFLMSPGAFGRGLRVWKVHTGDAPS